jgi:glycosyltransferase involved in cell wall biosynthesis
MKHFTIIIATYNASKYLERCLSSIFCQTFKDFEIIIIDSLSTDTTHQIITSNIGLITHYISEKDLGIYDAWNKGIRLSNGKWILMLGSDDELFPDALESYYKYSINNQSLDFISAKLNLVETSGEIVASIGRIWNWQEFKFKMNCIHVSALHNRNLFLEIGYFNIDFQISGDYELLLRKKDALKVGYIDKIVGKMQLGGISSSFKSLLECLKAKRIHGLGFFESYGYFAYLFIYFYTSKFYRIIFK